MLSKDPFLDFLVGGAMYRAVDASIRRFVAVVLVTHDVTMLRSYATKDKPSVAVKTGPCSLSS